MNLKKAGKILLVFGIMSVFVYGKSVTNRNLLKTDGPMTVTPNTASILLTSNVHIKAEKLTFYDRVCAQEAIEKIYYEHRIWPKENPTPRISFEQAVPRSVLEAEVMNYLKKSAVLDYFRHKPITPDQLQSEIIRMTAHTRQPEMLKKLFAALHNDPYVIAECLARPILADNIIHDLKLEEKLELLPVSLPILSTAGQEYQYTIPAISAQPTVCAGSWTPTSTTGAPTARYFHTAVWTGAEMIVWGGGAGYSGPFYNTGGRYNPATDSWTATSTTGAPTGRWWHIGVWTGSEMIVWGGGMGPPYYNTGGRYNPATDTWIATPTTGNCPTMRTQHSGVWTGTEMIVWGGIDGVTYNYVNSGARYNPVTNLWTPTSTGTNVPSARRDALSVWTGTAMIIWGGDNSNEGTINTGGLYDPVGDSWSATSTGDNVPSIRGYATAIWAGNQMVIWGGYYYSYFNDGGRYDPTTDTWTLTSTGTDVPSVRGMHSAVWTGTEMIVWGGTSGGYPQDGGRYNPTTDSWTATSTINAPEGRRSLTAVWTGSSMIVWGGTQGYSSPRATGGVYSLSIVPIITGLDTNTCPSSTVTLSVSGTYFSYQWNLNGNPIDGATQSTYDASSSGNYTVTVMDATGCVGTSASHAVTIVFCSTTEVSPNGAAFPLRLNKSGSPTDYYLYFQKVGSASGYNVYEGNIGSWYSHANAPGNVCNATVTDLGTGEMRTTITPSSGDYYYLVTAFAGGVEGTSGYASDNTERPPAQNTCPP